MGRVEHYSCGAAGLAAAVTALFLLYPLLLAFTEPLHLLSTTAIVFVFLVAWLTMWGVLELVWERRAGQSLSE